MTITDTDIKGLILAECGDFDDGYLADHIDLAWDSFADKAYIGPRLQELYAKRRLADIGLGRVREQVDSSLTADEGAKLSQMSDHLRSIRAETFAEILRLESGAGTYNVARSAANLNVTPSVPPVPGGLDANDPVYRGSPYLDRTVVR